MHSPSLFLQPPPQPACAVRIEFVAVEGFDKDSCVTVHRACDDKKKVYKSGKFGGSDAKSPRKESGPPSATHKDGGPPFTYGA